MPSIYGYFVRYLRCAQILILKICLYIPVVKIFSRLDLKQSISLMDGHCFLYQIEGFKISSR